MKRLQRLVPHYFQKEPISQITNRNLLHHINQIKSLPTAQDAINYALEVLATKYESKSFESVIYLHKLFDRDPNKLWTRSGFMHCTQQNYLLRILLVKGNKIADQNIQLGYSYVWHVSPHQFLIVHYKGQDIALDPWNYGRGANVGKFATGFGMSRL